MMNTTVVGGGVSLVVIILIVVIGIRAYRLIRDHFLRTWVKSSVDGRWYHVLQSGYKQQAADNLATIQQRMFTFVKQLYLNRGIYSPDVVPYIMRLHSRYHPDRTRFSEGIPDPGKSTFTLNKGESIVFCLAGEGMDQPYELNVLVYVAIHELAHVGTPTKDHYGPEFQYLHAFHLKEAIRQCIYTPRDFSKNPVNYCNVHIR